MNEMFYSRAILNWFYKFADQGIFTTDAELIFQSWNSWLEVHTGISAKDIIGRNLF